MLFFSSKTNSIFRYSFSNVIKLTSKKCMQKIQNIEECKKCRLLKIHLKFSHLMDYLLLNQFPPLNHLIIWKKFIKKNNVRNVSSPFKTFFYKERVKFRFKTSYRFYMIIAGLLVVQFEAAISSQLIIIMFLV